MAKREAKTGGELPAGVTRRPRLEGHTRAVLGVAFSPDGALLASASEDNTVRLWQADTGREVRRLEGHTNSVLGVAFSPDGALLASASSDNTVRLWQADTGREVRRLEGHMHSVLGVAFSPDGALLASASYDNTVRLWQADTGREVRRLEGHTSAVWGVAFSPDGALLASASRDNTARLWQADTGREVRRLEGHTSTVHGVAFSPDGALLASASYDNTVRLWQAADGRLLRTLEGHTGSVEAVAFSVDGRLLASKSEDHTIRLWSCATWETVAIIPEPTNANWLLLSLAFAPQPTGRSLLLATCGSEPGTPDDDRCRDVHLWELDLDALLERRAGFQPAASRRTGQVGNLSHADGHYRNAKVVLVGNTSVGKSGLGLVLAGRRFRATESSHGRHIWTMESGTTLRVVNDDAERRATLAETRETLLWDLAGQPGYRLVHQLHLSEVAVALVLFDARSETEPFAGVSYWARALDTARKGFPLKKFLVASRCDRGGATVSQTRIDAVVKKFGFDGYFETSAKRGDGVDKLQATLRDALDWENLPAVTRTSEFQATKAFLVAKKKRGMIVEPAETLFAELTGHTSPPRKQGSTRKSPLLAQRASVERAKVTRAVFDTCLQQLEATGLIRRLPFGDWVLLQPELLDDYCGWLTLAARDEPDGLGHIGEVTARAGQFKMDSDRPLASRKSEEQTLLLASVEEALARGLAIRETDARNRRTVLVFPAELRLELPDYPGGYSLAMAFRFHGPVRGIYASLVVKLIYSLSFERHVLHRNAALFRARDDDGLLCGVAVDFPDVEDDSLGRLTVFFADDARSNTRRMFLRYVSSQLDDMAFAGTVERQRIYHCAECDETVDPRSVEKARTLKKSVVSCAVCGKKFALDDLVAEVQQPGADLAEINQQAATGQRLAGLATTIDERRQDGAFDVFLCHNSQDKPAVRELAKDLHDCGLLGWIDEEQLRVIPVLLPGAAKKEIPLFLRRHVYVSSGNPFDWELLQPSR